MAHHGRERSLNASALPHMFRQAEGRGAHVPAGHGRAAKAMQFMARALLSLVTASAVAVGGLVTAASAAREQRASAVADIGGAGGAAGSRVDHAFGCGDGSIE